MSAEAMRAIVEYLVINKLKTKGKHVYLNQGGPLEQWATQWDGSATVKNNMAGCIWWLSKHNDHSKKESKKEKGLHVADLGLDFASMCAGPVFGAIFDSAMGIVGGPGVGGVFDTLVSTGIEVAQGRGSLENFADTEMAKLRRDQRSGLRGKPAWYDVAFDQDFQVGGAAAFVRYNNPAGVRVSLLVKTKRDFMTWLGTMEKRGWPAGAEEARSQALGGFHHFMIFPGQIVQVPGNQFALQG